MLVQILFVTLEAAADHAWFLANILWSSLRCFSHCIDQSLSKSFFATSLTRDIFVFKHFALLLSKAFWNNDSFWEAELAPHSTIIFVSHFDRNSKLFHAWSLKSHQAIILSLILLFGIVLHISTKDTSNGIVLICATCTSFELILSFLHLLVLFI